MLDGFDRLKGGLRLLNRRGDHVYTVPSIGATNILEHIIPDRDIVDSIITIVHYLADGRWHNDFEGHMFRQMMRYSILRSVVNERNQINRFFDNISKEGYLRRRPLFWLQWHMAKADMREFTEAEKYLEQGYTEALNYDRNTGRKYNRTQLDDRKAKFLVLRGKHVERNPVLLYQEMTEACRIVARLLREESVTRHPFQTLKDIVETFVSKKEVLFEQHRELILRLICDVAQLAKRRVGNVPRGYQERLAADALLVVAGLVPEVAMGLEDA